MVDYLLTYLGLEKIYLLFQRYCLFKIIVWSFTNFHDEFVSKNFFELLVRIHWFDMNVRAIHQSNISAIFVPNLMMRYGFKNPLKTTTRKLTLQHQKKQTNIPNSFYKMSLNGSLGKTLLTDKRVGLDLIIGISFQSVVDSPLRL